MLIPKVFVGETTGNRPAKLREALEYIGFTDAHHHKVFVKPNLTFPRHTPGVTTTPSFLRDLLLVLPDYCSEVFVGESNGGYGSFLADEAFSGHGLAEMCRETKSTLVNLSTLDSGVYWRRIGGHPVSVRLPRFLAEEVDSTISVPVLKVHAMTTVSLSIKNLWGCCPQDLRLLEHKDLGLKLALIHELTNANYGFVDATYGLDSHGPMEGEARMIGKFVAADDLLALDYVCSRMMGFKPHRIRHLRQVSEAIGKSMIHVALRSNISWEDVRWGFKLHRDLLDCLSLLCFHSRFLSKAVYDSPLTRPIYWFLGREPRRKLT